MPDLNTIKQKLQSGQGFLDSNDFEFLKSNYSDGGKELFEQIINEKGGGFGSYSGDFAKAVDYKQSEDSTQSRAFLNPVNDDSRQKRDELVLDFLSAQSLNDSLTFEKYVAGAGATAAKGFLDTTALSAVDGGWIFGATPEDITKGDLEKALGQTPEPETDPTTGQEIETSDIKPSEALQCLLLKNIGPLSRYYRSAMHTRIYERKSGELISYPYQGKIITLNSDPSPTFINNLTLQKNINSNFTNVDKSEVISSGRKKIYGSSLPQNVTTKMRLAFVKQVDAQDSKRLVELPILASQTLNDRYTGDGGDDENFFSEGLQGAYILEDTKEVLNKLDWSIQIKYEGTNPSTYRNDVTVKLTIKSNEIKTFTDAWKYYLGFGDNKEYIGKEFNLFDLVLFPYYESDSDGYGKIFKSQFSPNYNRVRLYLSTVASGLLKEDIKQFYERNSTVLDLTPVDHEFSRASDGKVYELSIDYRGYVQSLLTSPELDSLTSVDIKNKRKARDRALKQAAAQGCSLKEMQKISSQLNLLAENDPKTITYDFVNKFNERSKQENETYGGFGFFSIPVSTLSSAVQNGGTVNFKALSESIKTGAGLQINVNDISQTQLDQTSLTTNTSNDPNPTATQEKNLNLTQLNFFYLGDLLDVILSNTGVYDQNSNSPYVTTTSDFYKQNLRFVIGSFLDQASDSHINLAHIPISFDFFKEWYQETVLDKELFLYPALSMMRDLVERVVTNLLSEVCYTVDEKTSTLARVGFFTGVGGQFEDTDKVFQFWKTKYSNQNENYRTSFDVPTLTEATPEAPLIYPSFQKTVSEHINYCVLFTTGPQYGFNNATLSNTPHFYVDNSNYVGPANFSFKRTTETYMRESRYFRNSASGITQLAGVYDTTIDLAVPIYSIYPSTFYRITLGAALRYVIPNTNLDLFTELGINGYYSIKTVTIDLSGPLGAIESKVTINGIWTDAENPFYLIRQDKPDDDTSLSEEVQSRIQEKCLDIIDAVETSVQSLGRFGIALPELVSIDDIIEDAELALTIEEARGQEQEEVISSGQVDQNSEIAIQLNAQAGVNLPVGTNRIIGDYKYATDLNGNVSIYNNKDNSFLGIYNEETGVVLDEDTE